jgi:hypothetical protein
MRWAAILLAIATADAREVRVLVHGRGVQTMNLEIYVAGV